MADHLESRYYILMTFFIVRGAIVLSLLLIGLLPVIAKAHEVYLLSPGETEHAINTPAFDQLDIVFQNISQFTLWAGIAVCTVIFVLLISLSRFLEKKLAPFFERIRRYAALVARLAVGAACIAVAYFGAGFGPELPLREMFPVWGDVLRAAFFGIGLCLLTGFYVRLASFFALVIFAAFIFSKGLYMLTYVDYAGVFVMLLILGTHHGVTPRLFLPNISRPPFLSKALALLHAIAKKLAPYSFLILRVCFGLSLLTASLYAKVINNNLALAVANLPLPGHAESLAQVFGFEAHFLVLGAAIIEVVIALFFIIGIEIRFASLFVLFWLSLSLYYFGESVWPHIILIGIPIALFFYGYDRYSLEGYVFKKGKFEPVL